jgi:hypothetical protein
MALILAKMQLKIKLVKWIIYKNEQMHVYSTHACTHTDEGHREREKYKRDKEHSEKV